MGEKYKAKIFKSGNSLALRLPKALGLEEGEEVTLVPHDDGSFSFWRQDRAREVLMGLYGSMSTGFMADGRDDTAQGERDWSRDATQAA
ncbi:AbrB/MazE/SpoVT family DNA-binding domain-containing protein [Sphingobium lactosutens]|uniref:AbrB family transcriptional regulator n=1 Tax=Sphingobium lactosutens DS20 TaxID=1331060 RepID=T0HD78_9SPHN|nr:AbrB/MazE/SpoVT family DNA-binding domain-containing protein [Sphingobium lactosutens]EQB10937.1 AbrB family transcriptional regulator [Sphingobium lactosutens DS20]